MCAATQVFEFGPPYGEQGGRERSRNGESAMRLQLFVMLFSPAAWAGYTKLQYIGFPIQTGYNAYVGSNGLFVPETHGFGEYAGHADVASDVQARLKVFEAALDAATNSSAYDKSEDTLKVFMAPEFSWRPSVGGYPIDDEDFLHIPDQIQALVSDSRWKDWIFILGSNVAISPVQGVQGANLEDPLWESFNFALIVRGNSTERHSHFKEYMSSIDFLLATPNNGESVNFANLNLNSPQLIEEPHVPRTYNSVTKKYSLPLPENIATNFESHMGSNVTVFEMAGVSFCLDICLDHAEGVCAKALDEVGRTVQVQLISSAGMSIEPRNVRVPVGGAVLLSDGLGSGAQMVVETEEGMGLQVHEAEPGEAPVLDDPVGHLLLNDEFDRVDATSVKVFPGQTWRREIAPTFPIQKYTEPYHPGPDPDYPVIDAAINLLLEVEPRVHIFQVQPLAVTNE